MTPVRVSPLRQRMIEDLSIRQFGPKTQQDYVRVVADFARFLGRSPDQAEPEDLRRYQLQLASEGASPAKMNAAVSALRFFFRVTLVHCAPSLKHKAALSVAYGCGLRVSEIVHLKVGDSRRAAGRAAPAGWAR